VSIKLDEVGCAASAVFAAYGAAGSLAEDLGGLLPSGEPGPIAPTLSQFLADESGLFGPPTRFGALRASEIQTMLRFEEQEGFQLLGNPISGENDAFWQMDSSTTATVDFMGHPNAYVNWDTQETQFFNQIARHAGNYDFTVIDLTGASEEQIYQILEYVESLSSTLQNKIVFVGW
jgi:hypothetical protein